MTQLYGSEWFLLDWAQYAIKNQREMSKIEEQDNKMIDNDNQFARRSTVSIDDTNVATDLYGNMPDNTVYILPDLRKKITYDVFISALVRKGYGTRKIYAALIEKYGKENVPAMRTIQRRVIEYKKQ
jgi:hypothetical protein